jgi:transposase InsO family protein
MRRLHELCDPRRDPSPSPSRRGFTQQPQRRREQALRGRIVTFSLGLQDMGYPLAARAQRLRLAPRTLRQWHYDWRRPRPQPLLLGRPVQRAPVAARNAVLEVLDTFGPATGLPSLRDSFPDVRRAELQDLLRRYRRVWRQRHHQAMRILHWQVAGAVWAIDFSAAPVLIDGVYPYLLAVRDLASGCQLLWQPLRDPDAEAVVHALAMLCAWHGAPLVLKSDNGFAFAAQLTRALLHQAGVVMLFSPPYWPRYNGAIEAGIGSLKTRTDYHAARHDRPDHWTCDDVAAAQAEANATARPHGPTGPTPDQAWANRRRLTAADRALFQEAVNRHRAEVRIQPPLPFAGPLSPGPLSDQEERAMDRQAIQRALIEHHYLLFSRRCIPLPFRKKKVTYIL